MKSKILILSLSLSVAVSIQAQEEEKQVSMLIDFVSWGEDLSGVEMVKGNHKTPVTAHAFRYSKPYKYTGSQTLSLTLSADFENAAKKLAEAYETERLKEKANGFDVPDEPFVPNVAPEIKGGEIPKALALAREKNPSLAALVRLPADTRRVTILLAPGPQRSLVPYIIDDDPARHPPGTARVHNLSPHPISMRTAGKTMELMQGKSFFTKPTDKILAYEIAYQIDGKWIIQENNMVNVGSNDQMHMLVLRSNSSFFTSSDGSKGGFMQIAFLRRNVKSTADE